MFRSQKWFDIRESVSRDVTDKLDHQDLKWGRQDHALLYWLGILGEEFGELSRAIIEASAADAANLGDTEYEAIKDEAIDIAVVAHAIAEYMVRNND